MSDSASLQSLLAGNKPTPGYNLKPLALPTGSYQHPSKPLSSMHLINLMSEDQPENALTPIALVSTGGLIPSVLGTAGSSILEMNYEAVGVLYIVSGTKLYRNTAGTGTVLLGDVGTADPGSYNQYGPTIAVSPTAMVVCVPPRAYTCAHDGALNEMGGTFPGARSVCTIDNYFAFAANEDSTRWFVCGLLDPANFDALDFAYSDAFPDVTQRIRSHLGQIVLIGYNGLQFWYDSGDVDFPFRPLPGGNIPHGALSGKSIAIVDGSIFFLGFGGFVYRTNGYKVDRVSDYALEAFLIQHSQLDVVGACGFQLSGHSFYCLTIAGVTLVYDCSTKRWHQRSTSTDGNAAWAVQFCAGDRVFGGVGSGQIYEIDPLSPIDGGVTILRQFVMPTLHTSGSGRAFMNRLEVEMETGGANPPGPLKVEWSNDNLNYTGSRMLDTGGSLDTRKRVATNQLGSFQTRLMRFSVNGHANFYRVDADITQPHQGG